MNSKKILCLFIFAFVFIIQNSCQGIAPSDVPDGDPNKITGCQSYNIKTTLLGNKYQCVKCIDYMHHTNGFPYDAPLKLVSLTTGQKRCIKKTFYSQGCQFYTQATQYQADPVNFETIFFTQPQNSDPNSWRKPYTCASCLQHYTQIQYHIAGYYFLQDIDVDVQVVIIDGKNVKIYPNWFGYYISLLTYRCQKTSQMLSACLKFQGTSPTIFHYLFIQYQTYSPQQIIGIVDSITSYAQSITEDASFIFSYYDMYSLIAVFGSTTCVKCPDVGYILTPTDSKSEQIKVGHDTCRCDTQNSYVSATKFNANICWITQITHCLTYIQLTQCQFCQFGYTLNSNKCESCDCLVAYQADLNDATLCIFVGQIDVLRCANSQNFIQHCLHIIVDINQNRKCDSCSTGYVVDKDICITQIPHCSTYDNQALCSNCKIGYKLGNKKCEKCDCINGYSMVDNICSFPSVITVSQCLGSQTLFSNCAEITFYNSDPKKCTKCKSDYDLNADHCIIKIPQCVQYNESDICTSCNTGYKLQNSRCDNCDCVNGYNPLGLICQFTGEITIEACSGAQGLIPNCKQIDLNGLIKICKTCNDGYRVDKNKLCMQNISNCNSYDSDDKCITCTTGYKLQNSRCNNCDCLNGYVFDQGICKYAGQINVSTCSQSQTLFSHCQQITISSKTKFCDKCASWYTIDGSGCRWSHCASLNDRLCRTCQIGYLFVNGVCDLCNCLEGFNRSGIHDCSFNEYIETSMCQHSQLIIKGCKTLKILSKNNYTCFNCSLGYTKINGICQPKVPHCSLYNIFDQCVRCQLNYTLVGQSCLHTVYYCKVYDNITKLCKKCVGNRQLINQTCVNAIPNCKLMNILTQNCTQCQTGYQVYNGRCKLIKICSPEQYKDAFGNCIKGSTKNCGGYNKFGLCLKCKQNMVFNDNLTACQPPKGSVVFICPQNENSQLVNKYVQGRCVGIDKNCEQDGYSSSGCFKCKNNYYLVQGVCKEFITEVRRQSG